MKIIDLFVMSYKHVSKYPTGNSNVLNSICLECLAILFHKSASKFYSSGVNLLFKINFILSFERCV